MNKVLTISALVIMLLLQYSRQAAYLNCKIENISVASNCDCEKIMAHADKDDQHDKQGDIPKPVAPDELFCGSYLIMPDSIGLSVFLLNTAADPHFYSQLYIETLIHPPIVQA